jgi:quaternary ammonium compound-resistance protein SugE
MINPWFSLAIAGVFEVVWAVGLKYTDGFSRLWPSVFTLWAMAISLYFLALAIRAIPLGTGYAVWTGIGAAGTAIFGIILFAESANLLRLLCIGLIISGIVGLKLTSS